MTTTDPKLIERIARAMCREEVHYGDPERVIQSRVDYEWKEYVAKATAILPIVAAAINEAAQKERGLQSAREDSAYFNGAKQAMAMAEQSLDEARKWVVGGCGGRAGSLARAIEAKESQHG